MKNPLYLAGINQKNSRNFLVVSVGAQMIYSVETIREILYDKFLAYLGVSNTEFGILFTVYGLQSVLYIIFGWIHTYVQARLLLLIGMFVNLMAGIYLFLMPQIGFKGLLVVFFLYALKEVIYWPSVLMYIKSSAPINRQGTAFSLMEFIRKVVITFTNGLAIICFMISGESTWGIRLVIIVDMLILGFFLWLSWRFLPDIEIKKNEKNEKESGGISLFYKLMRNKNIIYLGLAGMSAYIVYLDTLLIVPFLKGGFGLSDTHAGFLVLMTGTVLAGIASLGGGFMADLLFKSPARMMKYMLYIIFISLNFLMFLPKSSAYLASSIVALSLISMSVAMTRGLLYAPLTELEIPHEQSGAALAIIGFLIFSPGLWLHILNGILLDIFSSDITKAYSFIFMIGLGFLLLGIFSIHNVDRKIKQLKKASLS